MRAVLCIFRSLLARLRKLFPPLAEGDRCLAGLDTTVGLKKAVGINVIPQSGNDMMLFLNVKSWLHAVCAGT